MEVTDIKMTLMEKESSLKALATIALDNQFAVRGMRVMERSDGGIFVSFPQRQRANGEYEDIAYPLNKDLYRRITDAVVHEYNVKLEVKALEAATAAHSQDEGIAAVPADKATDKGADRGSGQSKKESPPEEAAKPHKGHKK